MISTKGQNFTWFLGPFGGGGGGELYARDCDCDFDCGCGLNGAFRAAVENLDGVRREQRLVVVAVVVVVVDIVRSAKRRLVGADMAVEETVDLVICRQNRRWTEEEDAMAFFYFIFFLGLCMVGLEREGVKRV